MHHVSNPSFYFILFFYILALGAYRVVASNGASALINEVARANNQSLLWGPYKPNLYFGVRPRIPKSLVAGLMWANVGDLKTAQENFRHTCEQHEGMTGYGWDEYDIRKGGRETFRDITNNLDLNIDFIKISGGVHGGNWGVRVKGLPRQDDSSPEQLTTIILHVSLEGLGELEVDTEPDPLGFKGDIKFAGETLELGSFTIDVTTGPASNKHPFHTHQSYADKPLDRTMVAALQVSPDRIWQTKNILFTHIKSSIDDSVQKYGKERPPPDPQIFTIANKPGNGNIYFVQKVFRGEFEFDILFSSGSAPDSMTPMTLTNGIKNAALSFSERFEKLLAPQAPFNSPEYTEFSKSMFSNLVGAIGYFHGSGIVDRTAAPEDEEEYENPWEEAAEARALRQPSLEEPRELFTCIPSRPFFPRGFLWDEGFHLIPVIDWDVDLTLDIVKSWLGLIDEDGWIAREQILGLEARSKVPPEFTVQYPHHANPPTLFIILEAFIDKLNNNKSTQRGRLDHLDVAEDLRSAYLRSPELAHAYLQSVYPSLKKHYFWFKKTQWGDIKSYDRRAFSAKEAYRWRGRTVQHILTSGLDDYPRAQPPHPGELHTDLISWMGLATRSIRRIAEVLNESEDVEEFQAYETAIARNIDDLHWDDKEQMFCDATIDDYEESVHVCHKGYISIAPFLTGMIGPQSPRLKSVLDLIQDREELWTDYGIRSLSINDEFYGTGENYWKSPIWININHLILKNLYDIATVAGPHQEQAQRLYSNLRKNVVTNVFNEWKRTGFAWEQYNPETGHGQRTQHFTGWTSLVVKMMVMPDLPIGKEPDHDEL